MMTLVIEKTLPKTEQIITLAHEEMNQQFESFENSCETFVPPSPMKNLLIGGYIIFDDLFIEKTLPKTEQIITLADEEMNQQFET